MEYLIKTYTQEGETVLDFAAGLVELLALLVKTQAVNLSALKKMQGILRLPSKGLVSNSDLYT